MNISKLSNTTILFKEAGGSSRSLAAQLIEKLMESDDQLDVGTLAAYRNYAAQVAADIEAVQNTSPSDAMPETTTPLVEVSVEEGSNFHKETKITRHSDGTTEKEVTLTETVSGGKRVTKERWAREGNYVKETRSEIDGYIRQEITYCHRDGSLNETWSSSIPTPPSPPNAPSFEYKKRMEDGQLVETHTTKSVDHDWNSVTVVETKRNERRVHWVRTTEYRKPDLDLPGSKTFCAHSPQDLLKHLGRERDIRATMVEEEWLAPDGSLQRDTRIHMTSGNGKAELVEHKSAEGAPSTWELRKENDDGTWNSQIFFQTTEDTIVTRSHKEDHWLVQKQTEKLPTLAKASEGKIPGYTERRTLSCPRASAQEIDQRLSEEPFLAQVRQLDSYRDFMDNYQGPYDANISSWTSLGGTVIFQVQGVMTIKAADGTVLSAVFDGKTTVARIHAKGQSQPRCTSVLCEGERLEIGPDGLVEEVVEGSRKALKITVAGLGLTEELGSPGASKWAKRLGTKASGALAFLTAVQLAGAVIDGDMDAAAAKAAELGVDLSGVLKALGRKGSTLAYCGNILGAAGVILGLVTAVQDVADGKYTRATLGFAGAAGGVMTLAAAAGAVPVIGWCLVIASLAGGLVCDYSDSVRVARAEI